MEIDRKLVAELSDEYETAIQVLATLADLASGTRISVGELSRLSGIAHVRRSEMLKALNTLEDFGVTVLKESSCERLCSAQVLQGLQAALIGAQTYKAVADGVIRSERPDIVLTRPRAPSRLDEAINKDETLLIHIEETSDAFASLAASAIRSLTIMTPFLDESGADWALSLFGATIPGVRKHLILRFLKDPQSDWYPAAYDSIRSRLREIGVDVYDFAVPREDAPDFFETFHAKVVSADGSRAYVGSANLNRHSRETSMELGMLVAGTAAGRVEALLEKVRSIAHRQPS